MYIKMLFSGLAAQKGKSRSLEFVPGSSSTNEVCSKIQGRPGERLSKSLQTSLLDVFSTRQSVDSHEQKTAEEQKQENNEEKQQQQPSYPRRRSIIRSADIPRSISKKSVTFASCDSVFNLPADEHERDSLSFRSETNTHHQTIIGKDFVIIIRGRQIDDDATTDSSDSVEPYSFVSKSSVSHSTQVQIVSTTSRPSRKNLIHHLIYHHQEKKRRQSVKTLSTISRSHSTPNILFSSTPFTISPPATGRKDQEQPSKNLGTWLKSSSLGRFVKSLGKTSRLDPKTKDTKTKGKTRRRSSKLRRFSDYIL